MPENPLCEKPIKREDKVPAASEPNYRRIETRKNILRGVTSLPENRFSNPFLKAPLELGWKPRGLDSTRRRLSPSPSRSDDGGDTRATAAEFARPPYKPSVLPIEPSVPHLRSVLLVI